MVEQYYPRKNQPFQAQNSEGKNMYHEMTNE